MKRSELSKRSQSPVDPDAELDRMWEALRAGDHSGSMPAVLSWLKRRGPRDVRRGRAGTLPYAHPALVRGVAVCAVGAMLALAFRIPVAQELQDGSFVQWTVDGAPAEATSRLSGYHWVDPSHLSVSTTEGLDETTFLLWLPRAEAGNAVAIRDELAADSTNRAIAVYPIAHKARRPLYEAALRVIRIDIPHNALTESEVEEIIAAHLAAQGLKTFGIQYRKAGGKARIEVILRSDSL